MSLQDRMITYKAQDDIRSLMRADEILEKCINGKQNPFFTIGYLRGTEERMDIK